MSDASSMSPRQNGAESETASLALAAGPDNVPSGNVPSGGPSGWQKFLEIIGLRKAPAHITEARENLVEQLEHVYRQLNTPLSPKKKQMMENILSIADVGVDDVMVPRADINAIPADMPVEDVITRFTDSGRSKMPLYKDQLDDIVGVVHLKDILPHWGKTGPVDLLTAARPLLFVPPSVRVLDLLVKMQQTRQHMAIVVDEYGGVDGLLTIEDLVEEIVGDIVDEDDVLPQMVQHKDGSMEADARVELEDLEERLKVDLLPTELDEEIDTIGGLVIHLMGRLPVVGDTVSHPAGLDIKVVEANPRRINRVVIRQRPAENKTAS